MTEFLNFITKNHLLKKEKPLCIRDVIEIQKGLLQSGFATLPESFIDLLKICNGIKGEDGAVLGINPENKSLNIVAFNKAHNHSTQKIILGYDDFAFLVFDSAEQKYFLIDRTDGAELDDFLESEFSSAISSILHF